MQAKVVITGVIVFASVILVYLLAVIASTPIFRPDIAVRLAVARNWAIMTALATGMAVQAGLIVYSRSAACPLPAGRSKIGAGATGSAFSTFTSLLSLAHIGCCSLFTFWVSLLLGAGATLSLLQYSDLLTYVGFAVMVVSIALMIRNLRSRLPKQKAT